MQPVDNLLYSLTARQKRAQLARFVDPAGAVVNAEAPAAPDLGWLARHSWAWDPARLDDLIRVAAPATLYVCGGAHHQQ